MNLLGGNNNHKSDNVKNDRIKAKAAIPAARAIVTAAILLSGLSLISSFQQQPAIAQQDQNITGGAGNATNATTTGAGNATNATTTGTNGSASVNSSPSAESLTGGTTTGGGATTGGGEASGGVTNTPGGAAGPQVSP